MPRSAFLAPLVLVAVVGLAGCGTAGDGATTPIAIAAPPQSAELDWLEPYPADDPSLVFGVSSFTVTPNGWSAEISVENRSRTGWKIVDRGDEALLRFGVLLLPNGDQDEFEKRVNNLDVPTLRAATSYKPALPVVLEPGTVWRGTISAPGALPGGLWVRISFGPFASVGEPPTGSVSPVEWFTDHAHQLEEVAAVPA